MDESSIKENLARAREACNLSQTEAALRLGINRASFIKLEKGGTHILNKHIPALAEMYGVSVEALLLGYEPSEDSNFIQEEGKKQFQQMVDHYEALLKEARDQIKENARYIESLEKNVSLLEHIRRQQEKDLEKFSGTEEP
jgi:transcriptional regulator with XRE-family HTH domain